MLEKPKQMHEKHLEEKARKKAEKAERLRLQAEEERRLKEEELRRQEEERLRLEEEERLRQEEEARLKAEHLAELNAMDLKDLLVKNTLLVEELLSKMEKMEEEHELVYKMAEVLHSGPEITEVGGLFTPDEYEYHYISSELESIYSTLIEKD